LQATATGSTTVQLSWLPSTDDVGVTGYRIDRDGLTVARTASSANS